jgi:hypothetical protein
VQLAFVDSLLHAVWPAVRFETFTKTNIILVVACNQDTVEWAVSVTLLEVLDDSLLR